MVRPRKEKEEKKVQAKVTLASNWKRKNKHLFVSYLKDLGEPYEEIVEVSSLDDFLALLEQYKDPLIVEWSDTPDCELNIQVYDDYIE